MTCVILSPRIRQDGAFCHRRAGGFSPAFAVRVRDLDALDAREAAVKAALRREFAAAGLCRPAVARALGVSPYALEDWLKPHSGDAPGWESCRLMADRLGWLGPLEARLGAAALARLREGGRR